MPRPVRRRARCRLGVPHTCTTTTRTQISSPHLAYYSVCHTDSPLSFCFSLNKKLASFTENCLWICGCPLIQGGVESASESFSSYGHEMARNIREEGGWVEEADARGAQHREHGLPRTLLRPRRYCSLPCFGQLKHSTDFVVVVQYRSPCTMSPSVAASPSYTYSSIVEPLSGRVHREYPARRCPTRAVLLHLPHEKRDTQHGIIRGTCAVCGGVHKSDERLITSGGMLVCDGRAASNFNVPPLKMEERRVSFCRPIRAKAIIQLATAKGVRPAGS